MPFPAHYYRVGPNEAAPSTIPAEGDADHRRFVGGCRQHIEPWLSAVFQAEHLNALIGSGLTAAITALAGSSSTSMAKIVLGTKYDDAINKHADRSAMAAGRGAANIEDQIRSALALREGLRVADDAKAAALDKALSAQLSAFYESLLATERGMLNASAPLKATAANHLVSFLLSFASRSASRERAHFFTTNYDRFLEYGCDAAGLRVVDRFVGALEPVFRSSRVEVDLHYNPPGIRGEPRFLEGVIRLTKLHGSLDWVFDSQRRELRRASVPFGAVAGHSAIPVDPLDTVMIYPNPAKDMETLEYPYAELFRDCSASLCRPNAVAVTYGYGFGDDHINRVLSDMLTIPSTHLVVISRSDKEGRIERFCERSGRPAQISLLLGTHFGGLSNLVSHYLPKPAIDQISFKKATLLKMRGDRQDDAGTDPGLPPEGAP